MATNNSIQLLGVYRLDEQQAKEALEEFCSAVGTDDPEYINEKRAEIESAILVELAVDNNSGDFDISKVALAEEGVSPENWQAAWLEHYLDSDGNTVLSTSSAPRTADLRVAFFLHLFADGSRLVYNGAEFQLLEAQPMPDRLKSLVRYEVVD